MARKSSASAVLTPESDFDTEDDVIVFDAAEELMSHNSPAPLEDMQTQVKEAQEELLKLRHRQEEIERQQQHLEIIRQKKDRFTNGKRDLLERLTQATVSLDAELYNEQKLVEELGSTCDTYHRHLDILRDIQTEKWNRAHIDEELDRALALINEAESDYSKCSRRLASLRPVAPDAVEIEVPAPTAKAAPSLFGQDDLLTWGKRGFAFTLPLMAAMLVGLILAKLMF